MKDKTSFNYMKKMDLEIELKLVEWVCNPVHIFKGNISYVDQVKI